MNNIQLWKRRVIFLVKMPYLWGSVALLLPTLGVLFLAHSKQEACLRWWGMALQFFGVWSVLHDVRSAQRDFNQPGIRQRIKNKIAQWPKAGPINLSANASASLSIGGTGRITVRTSVDPTAPLDARIAALEDNFKRMDEEINEAFISISQERTARQTAIKEKCRKLELADAAISAKLQDLATGSFTFSLFGVGWLAVGMVLGSTSVELAKWMSNLARWTGWHWWESLQFLIQAAGFRPSL